MSTERDLLLKILQNLEQNDVKYGTYNDEEDEGFQFELRGLEIWVGREYEGEDRLPDYLICIQGLKIQSDQKLIERVYRTFVSKEQKRNEERAREYEKKRQETLAGILSIFERVSK